MFREGEGPSVRGEGPSVWGEGPSVWGEGPEAEGKVLAGQRSADQWKNGNGRQEEKEEEEEEEVQRSQSDLFLSLVPDWLQMEAVLVHDSFCKYVPLSCIQWFLM